MNHFPIGWILDFSPGPRTVLRAGRASADQPQVRQPRAKAKAAAKAKSRARGKRAKVSQETGDDDTAVEPKRRRKAKKE